MNIENRRADLLSSNRVFDISPEIPFVSRSFRFQDNIALRLPTSRACPDVGFPAGQLDI